MRLPNCRGPELFQQRRLPARAPRHSEPHFLGQGDPHPTQDYIFRRRENQQEVKLKPWLLSNDVAIVLDQVLRGTGIAILPEQLVRPHLTSGKLISILSEWKLDHDFCLSLIFTSHSARNQKVRAFIDYIASKFRRLPVAAEGGPAKGEAADEQF